MQAKLWFPVNVPAQVDCRRQEGFGLIQKMFDVTHHASPKKKDGAPWRRPIIAARSLLLIAVHDYFLIMDLICLRNFSL